MANFSENRFKISHFVFFLAVTAQCGWANMILGVADPTTNWNVVNFSNLNDFINDQQTGQADADIVGNAQNPGFYSNYDGTYIYYRVRLGKTDFKSGSPNLSSEVFWVGVDANHDGALDLFMAVDNSGSNQNLTFQKTGPGLNNSPSTTTIVTAQSQFTIAQTPSNYHYTSVNSTIDPTVTNTDLNGDSNADAFLSFRVRFAGIPGEAGLQDALATFAGIFVTTATPLSYVIATSTQNNSLNQDLGGVNGGVNSAVTWDQLGGLTQSLNLNGTLAGIPEPGTAGLFVGGGFLLWVLATRHRQYASTANAYRIRSLASAIPPAARFSEFCDCRCRQRGDFR